MQSADVVTISVPEFWDSIDAIRVGMRAGDAQILVLQPEQSLDMAISGTVCNQRML
jgi:hypothetical protein